MKEAVINYLRNSADMSQVRLIAAAAHIGCSKSTVISKLAAEGTSWMQLLTTERMARFRQAVLDCDEISKGAMADHLGVSVETVGDLTRTWSGMHFRDYKEQIIRDRSATP